MRNPPCREAETADTLRKYRASVDALNVRLGADLHAECLDIIERWMHNDINAGGDAVGVLRELCRHKPVTHPQYEIPADLKAQIADIHRRKYGMDRGQKGPYSETDWKRLGLLADEAVGLLVQIDRLSTCAVARESAKCSGAVPESVGNKEGGLGTDAPVTTEAGAP